MSSSVRPDAHHLHRLCDQRQLWDAVSNKGSGHHWPLEIRQISKLDRLGVTGAEAANLNPALARPGHDLPFSSQAERCSGGRCPETGHPIDAINSRIHARKHFGEP